MKKIQRNKTVLFKTAVSTIFIILFLFSGCTFQETETNTQDLEINLSNTSIGSAGDNTNSLQSFTYSIVITNNNLADIKIVSIEPILSESFSHKIIEQEILVSVNQIIPSKDMLEVSGEIIFDSGSLSKEDILDMNPFIENFKIIEEKTIKI